MEDKYKASILLHALGDTIGFKNGEWEFNYNRNITTLNIINELLYEFIDLGGINGINLKDWYVSDDTIYNMAVIKALLDSDKINEDMFINFKHKFVDAYNMISLDEDNKKLRAPGVTTERSIEQFSKGFDGRTLPYNIMAGGNAPAMRNIPIGLAYYGKDKREQLIKIAIISSKLTHNSAIGYLGGLTSALFAAYGMEEIPIEKWPYKLINILESDKVKKYRKKAQEEIDDYDTFINNWKKYIETKFNNGKVIKAKSFTNLVLRNRYYYENFTRNTPSIFIGESGYCAMIMAYDALLDCDGKWEKLIIYSALHFGDSDTVAAIAGGLYGIVYSFGDVPENNLKYLEFKKELINLSNKLYNKFNKL
jgi:ADP-ribosylglycohydrolase